jgi:hypothetical protein
MFTAILYVWPTTPWLQLRAGVCVLAVATMRLLNLAVPILYRCACRTCPNPCHPRALGGGRVVRGVWLLVLCSCCLTALSLRFELVL